MRHLFAGFLFLLAAALPAHSLAADKVKGIDALLSTARGLVAREALTPPAPEAAASGMLKGYMQSVDVYSTYLSPEEVRKMGLAKTEGFVGVGMDAVQDSSGTVYCLPFPGGPAEKAGVRHGDILHSVDGVFVGSVPFLLLDSMVRGKKGTQTTLGITRQDGTHSVKVVREMVTIPHVTIHKDGPFPRLRIFRFTPDTPEALREAILQLDNPGRLVLDLRGSPGGDLGAALACAALFLDRGKVMSVLVNRQGERDVRKAREKAVYNMPLALWQDNFTASAAEVFIAALSRNERGKSLGQRSFGKGVSQHAVGAGNGGIFILTSAKLLPPDGKPYHGIGLEPDLVVSRAANPEHVYFRRTYEAFGLRP